MMCIFILSNFFCKPKLKHLLIFSTDVSVGYASGFSFARSYFYSSKNGSQSKIVGMFSRRQAEFALAQHSMTRHFQVVSTFTFLRGDRDGEFPPSPPPPLFSIHPIKIANCSKNQGKDEISHPHAGL